MNRHRLFLQAGDLGKLAGLCLRDFEIGLAEFLGSELSTANSSLYLLDLFVLQGLGRSGWKHRDSGD